MPRVSPTACATPCDPQVFRRVIGHFASGVTVITARQGGDRFGMTASAVTSLSMDPPMLLVCINRKAPTRGAVSASRVFGVCILAEEHGHIAEQFAAPRRNKFEGLEVRDGASGVPLLADALARLECRVTEEVQGGTHSVFMAVVQRAEARQGAPLAYFRGGFGRLELAEDDAAYDELRAQVLNGGVPAARPIDIPDLAQRLGLEPWHVYHALTRLVVEGLVERRPGYGYVVAPVDLVTVEDALDGRRAIELGAADQSIGRASAPELAELRRRMEATAPLVRGGRFVDIERYTATNAAFHEYMVSLARSQSLVHAYRRLAVPGIMARTLSSSDIADDGLVDDHRQLVEAYELGDLSTAQAVIERHTERSKGVHRRAAEKKGEHHTTGGSNGP